ncbi:AHH domain-containing protein [Myxococcus sp. CA051A]|uniref:MXAN_0050 family toxin nuclease n=1 Tax=unclassified Myxococcus TaxID=2648731 RepID=UPI00157A4869|nr:MULTISPECIES: AHH domain-containing protein [unclassified Myxococcus]NTX53309.1 AHH domain-containing protein [Myxococcus sp. CA039A]NTX63322.1 AHH domain-containing protein [Myxococcus sp. CA051A]
MSNLSANEMNTALSQRLLAIFERSRDRKYAAAKEANKKKPKPAEESADDADHVDSNAQPRGVLGKDNYYAQNGSNYIASLDGRGVYRVFDHPHLDEIRDMVRETAEFPGGPPENFNPRAKDKEKKPALQKYPYAWEAHHILPGSAFYYELKSGTAFTYQQLRLILQSEYNLNHGHNIIMLPDQAWAVPVHALLQHPGDHPNYTQQVMQDMKVIAKNLQKEIDKQKDHGLLVTDIFNKLKELEDDYWDILVDLSRAVVATVTAGKEYKHPLVRYAPKDKKAKSRYEWGSLY